MSKLSDTELQTLLQTADALKQTEPYLRVGQCLFNTLYDSYPLIADEIRGTSLDPFYTTDERKIELFLEYLTT